MYLIVATLNTITLQNTESVDYLSLFFIHTMTIDIPNAIPTVIDILSGVLNAYVIIFVMDSIFCILSALFLL